MTKNILIDDITNNLVKSVAQSNILNIQSGFYPQNKDDLMNMFKSFKQVYDSNLQVDINIKTIKPRAILVPHAGYIYSGVVAFTGYYTVKLTNANITKIVILAPSHYKAFDFVAFPSFKLAYTPFGNLKIHIPSVIEKSEVFRKYDTAFAKEHSLDTQLPFIKYFWPNVLITPLITGQIENLATITKIARLLNSILDKTTLLVVSSDLSHYMPSYVAEIYDKETISFILAKKRLIDINRACGRVGINITTKLAKLNKWRTNLLFYMHSGIVTGQNSAVVGYSSILWYNN